MANDLVYDDLMTDKAAKDDEPDEYDKAKATNSIIKKMPLAVDKNGVLYHFNGKIYVGNADWMVEDQICDICENSVNKGAVKETIWRITNKLRHRPVEFNKDPFAFPALDGIVDLKTGNFRPYTRQDYFTYMYNAAYLCDEANYQRFLWFLCTSLEDPRDVLTAIDIITAVAIKKPFDSFIQLLGGGGNGKGIFEKVIIKLFTEDRIAAEELKEITRSNFGAGALFNTDAWIISEVDDVKGAVNFLKKVSTGELLDVDVKYKDRKKGTPHALPILDCNKAFDFGDDSNGRMRRGIKLNWPYQFDGVNPDRPIDKGLEADLTHEWELSGILKIIAARAPSLAKSMKIYERQSKTLSNEEYERQINSFERFCEDCLSIGWTKEGKAPLESIDSNAIYEQYEEYCKLFHVPTPISDNQFGRNIHSKYNITSANTSTTKDGIKINYRYYPGLYLVKPAKEIYEGLANDYDKYDSTTTDLLQIWIGKTSNNSDNTTDTTDYILKEVIEEIESIYKYIKGCKSPDGIKYSSYVKYLSDLTYESKSDQQIGVSNTTDLKESVVDQGESVVNEGEPLAHEIVEDMEDMKVNA